MHIYDIKPLSLRLGFSYLFFNENIVILSLQYIDLFYESQKMN